MLMQLPSASGGGGVSVCVWGGGGGGFAFMAICTENEINVLQEWKSAAEPGLKWQRYFL